MNFFAAQDQARRNTGRLVILFLFAVASLILLSNMVILFALGFVDPDILTAEDFLGQSDWTLFTMVSVGIAGVILIGTVYKLLQLSGGGRAVAEMMGGKLIAQNTYDYDEKKLINVVTEMSIASGTPVPAVYVMEHEQGINAFAAGYTQKDAVVAVTRGTLETLTRDELQGVIAHEFSHIFNGDMRLNIRLIGILHGILIIGILGYYILRAAPSGRRSRGNGAAPVALLGLGLMVVGYSGTFFGNLIKSAVSRQREYLADASAIQFTRNPKGIAGALKKIGGNTYGSRVKSAAADEISHTFFGEGVSHFMNFMMATHPPLDKRIRRIDPGWDGDYVTPQKIERTVEQERETTPAFDKNTLFTVATVLAAEQSLDHIGQPQKQHLDFARQMLTVLPAELIDAAQGTFSARAVVYFLLLSKLDDVRQLQINHLMDNADDGVAAVTLRMSSFQDVMRDEYRLSLLNICLSSLQQLTPSQYARFKDNIDALIRIDDKIELFEWALQKIVTHTLEPVFDNAAATKARYRTCNQVSDECRILLSVLWYAGRNDDEFIPGFDSCTQSLGIDAGIIARDSISLRKLDAALDELNQLYPLQKPALLKTCARVISLDGEVKPIEAELFRAIAEILDCPMPPLLDE